MTDGWPSQVRRVVFVAPRVPETSGGATYVENMSAALVARGIDVEHISLAPGTRPERFPTFVVNPRPGLHAGPVLRGGALAGTGWRVHRVAVAVARATAKTADRRWLRLRLRRQLRRYGDDTLLVFTHVLAARAVDESGWRVEPGSGPLRVGQHHSSFDSLDHETWLRAAIPEHFAGFDGFSGLTDDDAQRFAELLPGVPCRGIGNPFLPVEVPRSMPVADSRTAVAVARLSGEKQHALMVRAFVAAVRSSPGLRGWRLAIHGEGGERPLIESVVDDLDAQALVSLPGETGDPLGVLGGAGLALLTSSFEGFPMTVLEAAQARVPLVALDCSPGVRLLVGENGWLVPPTGGVAGLVAALVEAMGDDRERQRRGERAHAHLDRWHPDAVLAQWGEFAQLLLARRGAGQVSEPVIGRSGPT
ncbi:glycosyltransferase [Aestuariimicrobium soli]|uniref:glycosyltransferase n=1 Tax=Aestuariimicrobium soli TaxID=2035834 RepID=UPI003EBA7CF6